jgi:hypothetical protein
MLLSKMITLFEPTLLVAVKMPNELSKLIEITL